MFCLNNRYVNTPVDVLHVITLHKRWVEYCGSELLSSQMFQIL